MTWYPKDFVEIPMTDMRLRSDPASGYPGRTYRFYNGEKVYEFGHGLSYTRYSYKFVNAVPNKLVFKNLSTTVKAKNSGYIPVSNIGTESCAKSLFSVVVRVKNHGKMWGSHPVLLFLKREKANNGSPLKQLLGFKTVQLDPKAKVEVEYPLNPCGDFSRADENGEMVIDEGTHYLTVGDEEHSIIINI